MAISDPGSYPRSVELRYCPVNRVDETYMGAAENLSRARSSGRAAGALVRRVRPYFFPNPPPVGVVTMKASPASRTV
ncbi:hypothetical protein QFZ34_000104 [Phyllobacterium ifriqiyense]|uniref:Uncharacterized protein n=1 Tax=Phyllobacterium ifriqiyense TaxID=314238 RepID=A0ABU0S2E6_9HYPH|nr:hypothetical protein [Phyllobacterium ifriqiyense]